MRTLNMKPSQSQRRGLAPLEFVLWLPVFLFVMALMVNFGTIAAWRVRGEIVSRDAVWRVRWPRTGASEPRPNQRIWPTSATMTVAGDAQVSNIDVPSIQHPVVRGTLPNDFVVQPILDPDRRGALKGTSAITRNYPLLPKLGPYASGDIENSLLDEMWQVAQMGVYTNRTRRIPYIYQLPKTDQSLPDQFVDAVHALFMMPHFAALDVLDRDEELRNLTGRYWEFHPRVRSLTRTDPAEVHELAVKPLVDRLAVNGRVELGYISYRPRVMTDRFLSVFRQAIASMRQSIDNLQQSIASMQQSIDTMPQTIASMQQQIQGLQAQLNVTPPPSPQQQQSVQSQMQSLQSQLQSLPAQIQSFRSQIPSLRSQIQSLQAEIDELLPKVDQLEAYHDQLPEIEADLKQRYLQYQNEVSNL